MYKGTLKNCVARLAGIPISSVNLVHAIVHLPASKCYSFMTESEFRTHRNSTKAADWRPLWRGSLGEAAHFVLSPQLSMLVTEEGYPKLDDNQTPPLPPEDTAEVPDGDDKTGL